MHDGLNATHERFACPLNFHRDSQAYYSPFQEDAIFGALYNAFSCRWTGSSQAHPEYTPKAMQKAVRWAIGSATDSQTPCLTAFTLPFDDKSGTSYQQWLGHPLVHQIARIPKRALELKTPDAWKMSPESQRHPRHDVLLFVVANVQGIQTHVNPQALEDGMHQIIARAGLNFNFTIPCANNIPGSNSQPHLPFFAPKGYSAEIADTDAGPRLGYLEAEELPHEFHEFGSLKWKANEIIYTDGSVRDTGEPEYYRSGSGVHRPASSIGPQVDDCIDPIGDMYGVANTIQRAEAVGVQHALGIHHPCSTRVIATDSLCIMYMLSKQIRSPNLHRESKHVGILQSALENAFSNMRNGQKIQIIKVKSHIGIKGNEAADRLAHDACETPNCNQQALDGLPVREHIHWPLQKDPPLHAPETSERLGEPRIVPQGNMQPFQRSTPINIPRGTPAPTQGEEGAPDRQVNDLRKGMKNLIKARLAMGYSNRTIYVEAWQDIKPYVLGDLSNHFWTEKTITMPTITQTLRYRFGQLWNMKTAYQTRKAIPPGPTNT